MTPRDRLQRLLFEHRTAHDPASSEREILAMFDDLESATHDLAIAYMSGRYDERKEHTKDPLTCVQNRTGHTASGVERVDGKWCWVFEPTEGRE